MTSTVECACACLTAAATFVRGEWTGAPGLLPGLGRHTTYPSEARLCWTQDNSRQAVGLALCPVSHSVLILFILE